jgi:protein-export membrane protein SecD
MPNQVTNVPEYVVSLNFNDEGAQKFADATTKFVGQPIYILLDEAVISMPTVNEPITTGEAVISGDFTYEAAEELATLINSGNLPVELELISMNTVDATLGAGSLENAVKAAAIALVIIMLFMIAFYRLPGFMSAISLCAYTAITVLAMVLFNVNLTLSGIAGIVLSMGMAVDANVIIFDRIKEEYENGKTATASINAGFKRAVVTVLDSNVTTVLAAIVLWVLCAGSIKGFAITLFLGVLVSMFTAVVITRWLIKVVRPLAKNEERFLGLKRRDA